MRVKRTTAFDIKAPTSTAVPEASGAKSSSKKESKDDKKDDDKTDEKKDVDKSD